MLRLIQVRCDIGQSVADLGCQSQHGEGSVELQQHDDVRNG